MKLVENSAFYGNKLFIMQKQQQQHEIHTKNAPIFSLNILISNAKGLANRIKFPPPPLFCSVFLI